MGFSEWIQQKGLETHLQTRNAPQYRTFGQKFTIGLGNIAGDLSKKKGAIQYSISGGKLYGQGEGFSGTFTKEDIGKFSDAQFKDAATQLGIDYADVEDAKMKVYEAMKGR